MRAPFRWPRPGRRQTEIRPPVRANNHVNRKEKMPFAAQRPVPANLVCMGRWRPGGELEGRRGGLFGAVADGRSLSTAAVRRTSPRRHRRRSRGEQICQDRSRRVPVRACKRPSFLRTDDFAMVASLCARRVEGASRPASRRRLTVTSYEDVQERVVSRAAMKSSSPV